MKQSLVHLSGVDIAVIAILLRDGHLHRLLSEGAANTSEEFFMAGREMTAWIAG